MPWWIRRFYKSQQLDNCEAVEAYVLGFRERSLKLGSLTPGYMLTPLRG
jgi:hypothetical protein